MNILLFILGPILGIAIIFIYRYLIGYPFPWEITMRKLKNPDTNGVIKCFDMLKNGSHLDIVMGEMDSEIVNNIKVIDSLDNALEKNIRIRIIVGPEFDKKSKDFAEHLLKSKKTKFYQLKKRPDIHFRIIDGKHIYLEPSHEPLTDSKYWPLHHVRAFTKYYTRTFEKYKVESVKITKISDLSTGK